MVGESELLEQLAVALVNAPEKLTILSLTAFLLEGARKNDKRPAWLKLAVPDNVVLNLFGYKELRDNYLLVRIPLEVSQMAPPAKVSQILGPAGQQLVSAT